MEELIGAWLRDYGLAGLMVLVLALFVWRGLWPFFTTEYWPAAKKQREKESDAMDRISRSMVALEEIQRGVAGSLGVMENKVIAIEQRVGHIEEVLLIRKGQGDEPQTNAG